jgi:hypothetical protein
MMMVCGVFCYLLLNNNNNKKSFFDTTTDYYWKRNYFLHIFTGLLAINVSEGWGAFSS